MPRRTAPEQRRQDLVKIKCKYLESKNSTVLLFVVIGILGGQSGALAQLRPTQLQELFRDPPRADRITRADLPNLGRLVVLEATSMFVHARSELVNSPNGFRLLDQIREVWNAAEFFTAAVDEEPASPLTLEAGRLAYDDLQASYNQLRAVFSEMPGGAPLAGRNMVNMGRVVAVIGPLLRREEGAPGDNRPRVVSQGPLVRSQASEALAAVGSLEKRIDGSPSPAGAAERLHDEFQRLSRLLRGIERIAGGPATPQDLVASVRPIRTQIQRIDLELQRSGRNDLSTSDEWRTVHRLVDGLSDRLQLPREIVPERPPSGPVGSALLSQVDRSITNAEKFLEQPVQADGSLGPRLIMSDVRRLRHRLDLLQQGLVGQESPTNLSQATRHLERARSRLGESAGRVPEKLASALEPLLKDVDETLRLVREQLSIGR